VTTLVFQGDLKGVVEKRDFRDIQQKIPHGEIALDIAKIFAKIFCRKSVSRQKKRFSRKSDRESANFPKGMGKWSRKSVLATKTRFSLL
jgi:hypothetical protein